MRLVDGLIFETNILRVSPVKEIISNSASLLLYNHEEGVHNIRPISINMEKIIASLTVRWQLSFYINDYEY